MNAGHHQPGRLHERKVRSDQDDEVEGGRCLSTGQRRASEFPVERYGELRRRPHNSAFQDKMPHHCPLSELRRSERKCSRAKTHSKGPQIRVHVSGRSGNSDGLVLRPGGGDVLRSTVSRSARLQKTDLRDSTHTHGRSPGETL